MGILSMQDTDLDDARRKLKRVAERFMDMLTTGSAGHGDHDVLWLEIALGKDLVFCLS